MASDRERRYWDSFCFLAVLNSEEPYASTCTQILIDFPVEDAVVARHQCEKVWTTAEALDRVPAP